MKPVFYEWVSNQRPDLQSVHECRMCARYLEAGVAVSPLLGSSKVEWVFVGACPGRQEVKNGILFYPGVSGGAMLLRYFRVLGITRQDCYITDTCFCNAHKDRLPSLDEMKVCARWKVREFQTLNRINKVVLLGNNAARMFLGEDFPSVVSTNGMQEVLDFPHGKVRVLVVHHPGYILLHPDKIHEVVNHLERFKRL